ncbi:MAG: cytochrome c biogenesis protein ResB [Deltaproteobacteria bacterium]|nr:cytochrome c biogenesis protein ResB [Deltaproteobacteria bacterium]
MLNSNRDTGRKTTILYRLWEILSSLKTAIVLLFCLVAASILSTLIPQLAGGLSDGTDNIPLIRRILSDLKLTDVYHSFWYIGLAFLLCVNLTACMIRSARRAFRHHGIPSMPLSPMKETTFTTSEDLHEVLPRLKETVNKRFMVRVREDHDSWLMYGEKGFLRRLAPFIIHGSILVIIAGVALGVYGFNATVEIPEGETIETVVLKNGEPKTLGFQVRCDQFRVEHYENGMPKDFCSLLSFFEDNQVALQVPLRVNHPVSFHDIRFYQSGYSPMSSAWITISMGNEILEAEAVKPGEIIPLNKAGFIARLKRVDQNLMKLGPGIQITLETPERLQQLWVFKDIEHIQAHIPDLFAKVPAFNPGLVKPFTFSLNKVETSYITGLTASRDPGVPVVAAGAIFFLVGIILIFTIPCQRIWIRIDSHGLSRKISIVQQRNDLPHKPDKQIMNVLYDTSKEKP